MEEEKRLTTDELLKLLFKERSLEQFLQRNESAYLNTTFADYLSGWCRREHEVPEQLIRRANLEKSFGHQLFTGKRNPSRDTVIKLAFAMRADVAQTQEMLKIARERTGNIYVQPHQGFNSDVAASTKAHEALNHVIEWVKNGGKCFDEQLPYYGKTLDE